MGTDYLCIPGEVTFFEPEVCSQDWKEVYVGEYLLLPSHFPPFFSEWKETQLKLGENGRIAVQATELESARGGCPKEGQDKTTSSMGCLALVRNKRLLRRLEGDSLAFSWSAGK